MSISSREYGSFATPGPALALQQAHSQALGTRLLVAVTVAAEARIHEFTIEELRQLGQVVLATRKR